MHTAFAGAEEEKREWRKGDAHARCLESLQRDNWEHLAETSGDVSGAGGMGIYALQHFGGGGEAKSLSAWWQQTAGVRALVRGGIPAERRGQLWFELSGAAQKQAAHDPGYFEALAERATPPDGGGGLEGMEKDKAKRAKLIDKDLARTFAGEQVRTRHVSECRRATPNPGCCSDVSQRCGGADGAAAGAVQLCRAQ